MFTIEQINAAHARVKNGADFPAYVKELIQLGVICYDIYVSDGHSVYFGESGYHTVSTGNYDVLTVAVISDVKAFKRKLEKHQQGRTDYMTFCEDAAKTGVEKWTVDMKNMTCSYFDNAGNILAVEKIPGI
jgi:uncharacterized protein YbcV (DUF1398 family)